MGYLKYVKQLWKKPKQNIGTQAWKNFLIGLRASPTLVKLEHPTRPDRARNLGYKAKQGIFVVRSRVTKGGRKRPKFGHGRKPSKYGRFITAYKSDQWISEEHASRKYPNCEVLNSYWVASDGKHKWFEVILIDRELAAKYPNYKFIASPANRGRVARGLTGAAKKSRGLVR
ncbi:MAG: 50S ribosomal protein L15e [DPANN group archaeon]|nr:50S ribosomal protein L15e [DPANN group archaeon]